MPETQPNPQGNSSQKWYEQLLAGIGFSVGQTLSNIFRPKDQQISGVNGQPLDNNTLYIIIGGVIVLAIVIFIVVKKK